MREDVWFCGVPLIYCSNDITLFGTCLGKFQRNKGPPNPDPGIFLYFSSVGASRSKRLHSAADRQQVTKEPKGRESWRPVASRDPTGTQQNPQI